MQLQAGVAYRIGFLSGGTTYYGRTDMSSNFQDGTINTHYEISGDSFPTNTGGSFRWILVDLSYSIGTPVAITPATSGTFSSGVWSGNASVQQTAVGVALMASDGASHTGTSNTFDVQSLGTLDLTLASQVSEGAGTLSGTVTISPAPAADVVVALSSTVVGAAVPATPTVTVAAGSTSAPFTLNIADDAVLDGPQTTQIGAVGEGYMAAVTPLVVADDEGAVLTVNLAQSSYSEGAGVVSGTITSDSAPTVAVTVNLSSSDTSEATVPVSVTLPAGATSVPFDITFIDDTLVDGDQNVVLTAAVAGWGSGTKNLTVTDNEARTLVLAGLPASISEGAATLSTPTISLTGQAAEALVVTLTSSDTTALPSITVTIPAGASSAAFDLDPVDDLLLDGTQNVTLTASAATFTDATANVAVLDDDVHHFALSTVPSPQKEGVGFTFTATAKDINDVTISTAVGGPVNLTAAGDAGAVSVQPAVLTPFASGIWTGNVRVMGPGTNVKLAVASPTATTQSNAFDVSVGPHLEVNPSSYALSVAQNTSKTRTLTLNNTGAVPLTWSLSPSYVLSAAPGLEFTGLSTPISKEEAEAQPSTLWSQPRTSDGSAVTSFAAGRTLEDCQTQINARYAEITALIPSRYDFTEGVTGTSISDGGGDMYDSGNYLNTDLGTYIPYSDNVIATPASSLGTGGRYFTRKQPGLFLFVADVASISSFSITGNLGADGSGAVDGAVLTASRGSTNFKGFVKRVYNAGDPSVNHLVIVADNGSAAHTYSTYTDSDQHTVTGLAGVTRVYYLLYAGQSGGYINDAQTLAIFSKFIDIVEVSNWLTATPTSGTIAPGGSAPVQVTFNASSMQPGTYQGSLQITSNDAVSSPHTIPATMTVTPGLHHLEWDTLPSPQVVNTPVTATIRAKDAANALVTDFEGTAALSALNTAVSTTVTTGTGTSTDAVPFNTASPLCRNQCIYTPAEVGAAGSVTRLSYDVATLGTASLGTCTIRLKHTTRVNYGTDTSFDNSGWTTVYSGPRTLTTGWNEFIFTTPFFYNGTDNLMVDVSVVNPGSGSYTFCRHTSPTPYRSLYSYSYSTPNDPLSWTSGDSVYALPNMRLLKAGVLANVSPVTTPAFTGGVWTGEVLLGTAGTIEVTATAADGAKGVSNPVTTTASGTLALTIPASLSEGQGLRQNAGTVSVPTALASPLTITLESLDPTEITLPSSVTLPAGQTSVTFDITVADDAVLDGSVAAQARALAAGYPTVAATTTVADNETTVVTVALPVSMTESFSTVTAQGTVSLATPAAENLTVQLVSSLPSRITVPATVTIAAGQSAGSFTLTLVDNSIIDGNQPVTITATLAGSAPGTGTLQVIDNETTIITLNVNNSSVSEGSAPVTTGGYITLSGTVTTPLVISLSSSDTSELTVPATVTLAAGSSSTGYFTITPVNDTLQDGSQSVIITASAAGFTSGTRTMTVLDDELHHFAVSTVATPQVRNGPFNVTFTAKDINNTTIGSYAGSPVLTAAEGATSLGATPATVTTFSSGAKTQSVTVQSFATAAVLTLTDAGGGSGSSNAFAVGSGSMHHFGWATVPSPQPSMTPFAASVQARDAYENVVTSFTGTLDLKGAKNLTTTTSGTGSYSDWFPFGGYYPQNRCQMIYLPSEVGAAARKLQALAFEMTTPSSSYPAVTLSDLIIRIKHTPLASYSSAAWESTGWTTVFQGSVAMNETGWRQINFTTPFDYDGTSNLMVDISSNNAGFANRVEARNIYTYPYRVARAFTSGQLPPVTWSGTTVSPSISSYLPALRLLSYEEFAVAPAQTTPAVAGVWSGNVTVDVPGSISLMASHAASGQSGASNAFTVTSLGPIALSLPASSVSENAGTLTGTLTLTTAPAADLTVALTSSKPAAATVPATVVIPAGQTSVTFPLSVVDNSQISGTQSLV
ncbi:MAG: hypothetical protein B7Z47_01760, partial [Chthoniobacter sp. 12-60-6]